MLRWCFERRRAKGVQVQAVQALKVQEPAQFERAFSGMVRDRADALMLMPDSMFYANRTQLVALAAKNRLPVVSP